MNFNELSKILSDEGLKVIENSDNLQVLGMRDLVIITN